MSLLMLLVYLKKGIKMDKAIAQLLVIIEKTCEKMLLDNVKILTREITNEMIESHVSVIPDSTLDNQRTLVEGAIWSTIGNITQRQTDIMAADTLRIMREQIKLNPNLPPEVLEAVADIEKQVEQSEQLKQKQDKEIPQTNWYDNIKGNA